MDTPASDQSNLPLSAQRRFFQWAVKWFYTQSLEDTSTKPDVPSLVMLLQAVGFQLREFEKEELEKEGNVATKESVKLTIKCGTSKMKAVLEMDGIDCQCPTETKEGSLWSICGHAPASNDSISSSKYEETGTNLLPTISKETNNVVRDVVYRLFKIMNNPSSLASAKSGNDLDVFAIGNVDIKSDSHEGLSRSHTQPDFSSIQSRILNNNNNVPFKNSIHSKTTEMNVSNKIQNDLETRRKSFQLQRQKTWDLDLDADVNSKSPKMTISPTSASQISFGQLSIISDDEPSGFIDYVLRAYNQLDKAVSLLSKKTPVTSSTLSLNDQSFVKPTPPPPRSMANSSINSVASSRPGSVCSMPSRLSQKIAPMKALRRPADPVAQKLTERTATIRSGMSTTPLRRQSLSAIPPRAIPSRLSTLRSCSPSSMNSSSASDKLLLTKTPVRKSSLGANTSLRATNSAANSSFKVNAAANTSPKTNSVVNNLLKTHSVANTSFKTIKIANNSPKTNSVANTSLKMPTPTSKLIPPTSIANGSNRFGYSRK